MASSRQSFTSAWSDYVGSISLDSDSQEIDLQVKDISEFVSSVENNLKDWGQLFTHVPADHERRKEALGGALKLKAAGKRFEKVSSSLAGTADSTTSTVSESLIECQKAYHDVVHGFLEVSFPVHEFVRNEDFKDPASVSAALERLKVAQDLTAMLGKLFVKGKIEPASVSAANGNDESISPEVAKMLEKAMAKQKKKDAKKKKGDTSASDLSSGNLKAAKAIWEQTEGRCSNVLGHEVWEGLCWHRGMFLFGYVKHLIDKGDSADGKEAGSELQPVSRSLFLDAMSAFQTMLLAQGPVAGNEDDPALWQKNSDGPHRDESQRMFYQGIYTSTHLRALKHMAELSYWQWKHSGMTEVDAKLSAFVNEKFVHVVRHIMPHAGWTADIEYDRILEMESKTLGGSSEFSAGLGEAKSNTSKKAAGKSDKAASNKAGSNGGYGGASGGGAAAGAAAPSDSGGGAPASDSGLPATGSAVSSTAPA
eukprot:TRINITY_DN15765_c1_g1_i13.p1 TRINITY_DN15765_c1_g1~~TRINITY_DN15765_c1_g1_i13.p1  ORF type:complete len:500 (-),score=111.98 TRINITY_DN15765_c1_g1_i13:296-1735(-)